MQHVRHRTCAPLLFCHTVNRNYEKILGMIFRMLTVAMKVLQSGSITTTTAQLESRVEVEPPGLGVSFKPSSQAKLSSNNVT